MPRLSRFRGHAGQYEVLEKERWMFAGAPTTDLGFGWSPTLALHKSESSKRRLARAYGYTAIAIRTCCEAGASSGRLNKTHTTCAMPSLHPSAYSSLATFPGPASSRRSFALTRLGLPWLVGLLRSFSNRSPAMDRPLASLCSYRLYVFKAEQATKFRRWEPDLQCPWIVRQIGAMHDSYCLEGRI